MALSKQQQNMAAAGIMAVLAVGALFIYVIKPMNLRIDGKVNELSKIYREISSLDAKARQLDTLKRQNEILTEELKRTEKRLPSKAELANMLRYINETTQISAINVQSFRPLSRDQKQYFEIIPFAMDVTGSYHNMAQFINTINQAERIISVKDMVMNNAGTAETVTSETLRCSFTIMTLSLIHISEPTRPY